MDQKGILEKAITKAIAGGWKYKVFMFEYVYPSFKKTWNGNIIVATSKNGRAVTINYIELFFDHDFAKALWGDPWAFFTAGQSGDTIGGSFINWKGHLANMIVADNPIKYLGENI